MAQVLIRNLDDDVVAWLKREADKAGTSVEQYLRDMLTSQRRANVDEALRVAREIRARSKPAHRPSEDLIREDRDR